jgi:hypothetical protein
VAVIQRVNLIPDPSFDMSSIANGLWTSVGCSVSYSPSSSAWAGAGAVPAPGSMLITWAAGSSGTEAAARSISGLAVGQAYTLSCWVLVPAGSPNVSVGIAGGATGPSSSAKGVATRLNVIFTATATTHTVEVINASTAAAGQLARVGGMLLETGSVLYPFFSGEYPGAYWGPGGVSAMPQYDTAADPQLPAMTVEFDARPERGYWPGMRQATPDWGYGRGLGEIVLDDPAFPLGTGVLSPTARWLTLPTAVQAVSIRRGRGGTSNPIQPGTATITLNNRGGWFDTDAASGPFSNVMGAQKLRKGMRVRICASWTASADGLLHSEPLFVGRLSDVTPSLGFMPTTVFTAVDDLTLLSGQPIAPQSSPLQYGATTTARAQLAWLFSSAAAQPGAALSTSPAMTRQLTATAGGGTALSMMQAAVDAEGGRLFAARSGTVTALALADEYASGILAVLTDQPHGGLEYRDPVVSPGMDSVINQATVTRGVDASGTAVDAVVASAAGSDGSSGSTVEAPLLNYADATALAAYLAGRWATPATRVDSLTVDLAGQAWPPLLLLELGGQVQFSRTALYGRRIELSNTVEGIALDVSAASGWVLGLQLSPIDTSALSGAAGPFLLGVSLLNGAAVLTSY